MKKNIIITGGNGQDAKILAKMIKKFNIYLIINKIKKNNLHLNHIHYSQVNLLDFQKTLKLIKKINPIAIIHLASKNETAIKKKYINKLNYKKDYLENFIMTKNILDSIVSHNSKIKFVFAGSSQMFSKKKGLVTEKSKFKGSCHYSNYKIDSYKLIKKYEKKYRINSTMAIFFNHDSIHRNKKFLLPRIVSYLKFKKYKKLNEIFKENIKGDFSHAEDICNAIYKITILKKLPDKIILSSNNLSSINDFIHYGVKKLKIKNFRQINHKKDKKLLIGNNTLAKKKLNWKIKKNSFTAFKEILKNS